MLSELCTQYKFGNSEVCCLCQGPDLCIMVTLVIHDCDQIQIFVWERLGFCLGGFFPFFLDVMTKARP